MKITAWRIFKKKLKASAFTGEGARRFGGRWNSKGKSVIYASQSPSLAVLEILVHLQKQDFLNAYLLAAISFDDSLIITLPKSKLPSNWRNYPAPVALQKIGDKWLAEGTSVVLKVPSVLLALESNYLIDPIHPDFSICLLGKPQPFSFDPRLIAGR